MSPRDWDYDANNETAWVDATSLTGQTLVGRDEIQPWIDAIAARQCDKGPLSAVNYVFADEAAARYNRDNLAFARIGTYLMEGGRRAPLDGEAPMFDTREDFGVE